MQPFVPPYLDLAALRQALDAERTVRGLTWTEVARQLQIPTVRDMGAGSHIQADAVLLILQWLGRRCDEFVVRPGGGAAPWAGREPLPAPPPLFARFDTIALHTALNRVRETRGMSWAEVATELATTPSVLSRLVKGGRTSGQFMVAAAEWAGEPVEALLQPSSPFLGPARMDAGGTNRRASRN